MKHFCTFVIIAILSHLPNSINAQEYYFRFFEKDINIINTVVTSTVSIDNLVGDTVYAYANPEELNKIKQLGYKLEMLPHPSSLTKNRLMATTVEEMVSWDRYPTYEVYRAMMKKFEQDYPEICKLDSIGTTVYGRKLYVVKISDNVLEDESEPEFFYTSTMHGDETTGKILTLRLIDSLLTSYNTDSRLTNIVNNIEIYINPNANPDGTYKGGNHSVDYAVRYNGSNFDLNRNFRDPRVGENPNGAYQPETIAMMNFAESRNFVLSANFHGGIELANYPWDSWTSSSNPHPDQNWYYAVSRQYADLAQANSPSGYFADRSNGVTHGGDWYVISGGRQDYMNYWHHCREITLEISNTKNPVSTDLPMYWNYNKEAMLTYMELVFTGIQGFVTNSQDEPLAAIITIEGHDKFNSHVITDPLHGNYIRMIEPGSWDVTYSSEGYKSQTHTIEISSISSLVNKDIVLLEDKNTVTFNITDGENFVSGASIAFDDEIQTSDENGQAFFVDIPDGEYDYSVTAEGFVVEEGSVTVEGDIDVDVALNLVGIELDVANSLVKLWPNPFVDKLNIQVDLLSSSSLSIEVYSVTGQKISTIINSSFGGGSHNFYWDPSNSSNSQVPGGIYIIRMITNNVSTSQRVLFSPKRRYFE